MINIEKPESIGYQSSIEKGFDVLKGGSHAGHRGAHTGHGGSGQSGDSSSGGIDKVRALRDRADDTATLIKDELKDSDIKNGQAAKLVERIHSDLKTEVDSIKDPDAQSEFGSDLKRIKGALDAGKATEDLKEARSFLATGAQESAKLASAIVSYRRLTERS